MSLRGSAFWIACIGIGIASCSVGQRLVAEPVDYARYRDVRVASDFEARLRAGWTYLRTQPEGRWRAEVRAWFVRAEERWLRRIWGTPSGLYAYLKTLPDGPHAAEVRTRLRMLEEQAKVAALDDSSFMRQQRERERRFAQAAAERDAFRRALADWLLFLAEQAPYGQRRDDWSDAFAERFVGAEPNASCLPARCERFDDYEFPLPVATGHEARPVTISTVVERPRGRVERVVVSAPALFDAIAESVTRQRVPPGDLQTRAEAIGTAVQWVSATLELAFPFERCATEALSPVVLARQCAGQRVSMIAGDDDASDRIEFTRVLAAPPGR